MGQSSLDVFCEERPAGNERSSREETEDRSGKEQGSAREGFSGAERRLVERVVRKAEGVVDEIYEGPDGAKIVFHRKPGVKSFREPVKCPVANCNAFLASDYDLRRHLETHWKPLKND